MEASIERTLGKHCYTDVHTIRLLSLGLLGGLLANPCQVPGQDHLAPAPFPQPNFRAIPLDSAALARTNIDPMPILKIASLDRFPMPRLNEGVKELGS